MKLNFLDFVADDRVNNICSVYYQCKPGEFITSTDSNSYLNVEIIHDNPIDSVVKAFVSSESSSLRVMMLPAINGGKEFSFDDVYKIVYTDNKIDDRLINRDLLHKYYDLMHSGTIIDNIIICESIQPENGEDGKIQFFFEESSIKPVNVHEKGKVNFKEQNRYINVKQGQLLARVIPPTKGKDGIMLNGFAVPAAAGKPAYILFGSGTRANSSESECFAAIDGYVVYENNTISVLSVLNIPGNIDYNTGNIDFIGDVMVGGDVLPGFSVRAKNISVKGKCQGAHLTAKENIVVDLGINDASDVSAGGDIIVGYCENSQLLAKNNIVIKKYAYNCQLNCGNMINSADSTTIAGGMIVSFAGGNLYDVGTKSNAEIKISVGKRFGSSERLVRIKEEIERLAVSLEKITAVLENLGVNEDDSLNTPRIKKLVETKNVIFRRIDLFIKRMDIIKDEMYHPAPIVRVKNDINDGAVILFFDNKRYVVKIAEKSIEFYFDNELNEIKRRPYGGFKSSDSYLEKV